MPRCHVCGGSEFIKEEGFLYCSECQTQCKFGLTGCHSYENRKCLATHCKATKLFSDMQAYQRIMDSELNYALGVEIEGVSEQVFDLWRAGAQHENKIRICEQHKPASEEDSWTTWEAYNYVLKGMVDELLELGASPNLKAVVIQLWVRYLQRIDVAFLKSAKKLPKLGPKYQERDAKVLYSWPTRSQLKKKKSKGSASSDISSVSLSRARAKARQAFVKAQHDKESTVCSDVDSSFHSDQLSESSVISGVSSTKLLFRKNKYMTEEAVIFNRRVKKREKSLKKEPWKKKIKVPPTETTYLCKVKLLAIIHLGLLICRDDIQLSDLLRWIREGHLSYCSVIHFLPPKMAAKCKCIKGLTFQHYWPSHLSVRKVAGSLVDELKIDSLPTPSLPNLIRRYAKELELPGDLADFAVSIWADCQPEMPLKSEVERGKYSHLPRICSSICKELPNYEGRAMSFLLFSLKLIFGLDGCTEEYLSKFASKANKILGVSEEENNVASNESGALQQKLFVWKDWVKYIEFRNSLISRWSYPLYTAQDPGHFQINHDKKNVIPKLPPGQNAMKYLEFCEYAVENKKLDGDRKKDRKWVEFMKKHLMDLTDIHLAQNCSMLKFTPSLTPCHSYMDELLREHSNSWQNRHGTPSSGPCHELLHSKFNSTSLDFILKPQLVINALSQKDVHVDVTKSSALGGSDPKQVKFHEPISLHISVKNKMHDMMSVCLEPEYIEKKSKKLDWMSVYDRNQFLNQIQTMELNCLVATSEVEKLKSPNGKRKRAKVKTSIKESGRGLAASQSEGGNGSQRLKLFLPYHRVWVLYGAINDLTEEKFSDICSRMPSSFSWLLYLCANLLEMSEMSLYNELVNVELVHKYIKHCFGFGALSKTYECYRTEIALATW